jgi:oligo-1,6-glucosidase
MNKIWWKEAVVYQIYPRSFYDANGDGIGDLKGIIAKLSYLKELGIDVIWLSPHYKSPNADNGYDISDYEGIMDEFGSMADFDELLANVHRLGLKLMIDLVVNHSSDEHYWFQEARKASDNPYRNYYIWKKNIPNDWISFFSGPAWSYDEASGEYYLHLFSKKQPDLNWENEELRKEIYRMMHFWLHKGVDGFRMDVISLLSKDPLFGSYPPGRFGDLSYYANGPKVHEYLKEMNAAVLSKYNCMTVGEAFGVSSEQALDYTGAERNELQMIYHFDHAVPREERYFAKAAPEFQLIQLKAIYNKWNTALRTDGWNTVYFGNHDNPRMISRFGDAANYHFCSATMLATVVLTLRGTPYLYQGDEIGMTNCVFDNIEEFNDLQVLNAYQSLVVNGNCTEQQFMKAANCIARDNARTPMQWSAAKNAGFSLANKTWLKVNDNYKKINVESQRNNSLSVLSYYKKLLAFRKQSDVLKYGDYNDLEADNNCVWIFTRTLENETLTIACNFTASVQPLSGLTTAAKVLVGNYGYKPNDKLRPFEAIIFEVRKNDFELHHKKLK